MSFSGDLYQESGADVVMTTKGDMVDYNTERQRLAIGSTGQVLQVASSLPTWATLTTADSVLTTQGDVLYEGASALARLGQSTNNYTLATKGAGANPAWQASSTSTMSGTGDVLYSSGANTLARLAIGSTDDVLTVAGGVPTWASAGGGGAWTSEGTATASGDTTHALDITLNNAFDEDKAVLYLAWNGAQASTTGQDWEIAFNGLTSNYAKTSCGSQNGGAIGTSIQTGEAQWALSNQYNTDWYSGQAWLYITENQDGTMGINGRFELGGSGDAYGYLGNNVWGILYYESAVSSITSIKWEVGGAVDKYMKNGSTISIWSLAKS